jgi:hypothetical protein
MKKFIPTPAGLLLGLILGLLGWEMAAGLMARAREPRLFGSFMFSLVRNAAICDCANRPPQESRDRLLRYWQTVQKLRDAKPEPQAAEMLALESGLTDVRLSVVDQRLGNTVDSNDHTKRAQQELSALGWTNVSAAYLQNVVNRWDAQYKTPRPTKSTAQTAQAKHPLSQQ